MADQIRGFAFPFRIDPASGGVAQAEGLDKIRQNVRVLLGTRTGERPMLPTYGTPLAGLVQDPNDDVLADAAQSLVQKALLRWEPRILLTGASIGRHEGEVHMRLDYVFSGLPQASSSMILPLS